MTRLNSEICARRTDGDLGVALVEAGEIENREEDELARGDRGDGDDDGEQKHARPLGAGMPRPRPTKNSVTKKSFTTPTLVMISVE